MQGSKFCTLRIKCDSASAQPFKAEVSPVGLAWLRCLLFLLPSSDFAVWAGWF